MGFLRGMGKFFGSVIFTTFLVFAILMMDIVSFTSYDNVKSATSGLVEEQLFSSVSEQDLSDLKSFFLFQCSQNDRVSVPIFGGQQVILRCSDVGRSDTSQLRTLIVTSLIDSFYYKDFSCSFVDCVKGGNLENLLIVASNEGNQFYKSLQAYLWIGTAIGLVIILVSIGTWTGRLKGIGLNLVFTGLPFLFLGYIQSLVVRIIAPEMESIVKPLIEDLTTPVKDKFIIVLVIGIALVVVGYALGFYLSRKGKRK